MAYHDPGKEIEHRVSKLIERVNNELQAYYAKHPTPKAAQLAVSLATGEGAKARTPEEQAGFKRLRQRAHPASPEASSRGEINLGAVDPSTAAKYAELASRSR